ncbi:MAG TPA: bifunctional phosphoglucose/phosphomannose isomerase [Acidimicrobiales bacterium]|nr:bifunctional phosphoglucose/phosphomannose isomerase [Acidimicrobiales bacterium]
MEPLSLDTLEMLPITLGLPEQVERAVVAGRGLPKLPRRERIENVVVLGMGGSGVAGDLLLAVAAPFMPVPVVVVKGYTPPQFVDDSSLVFAVSFSGDTEETVEAATEAAVQGATVVAVTGGGELAERASSWGAPIVPVPTDIPQPRAAIGAMAVPPLVVLEEVGLFPGASQWIALAVDQLKRRRDQLLGTVNPARELARRIGRTIPLVYSAGSLGSAAAMRWKTQFNENAKIPSFWAVHPELCHNEVAGWGQYGDATRQLVTIVNLRTDFEHPQVMRRFELVDDVVREAVASIEEVVAQGEGALAQLMDLVLFGDCVSLYMAAREGVDPGPVPVLGEIKAKLGAGA